MGWRADGLDAVLGGKRGFRRCAEMDRHQQHDFMNRAGMKQVWGRANTDAYISEEHQTRGSGHGKLHLLGWSFMSRKAPFFFPILSQR